MRLSLLVAAAFATLALTADPAAAQDRAPSPRGEASTQIDGDWIVVDYGRPILRGRTDIFGSPADYGTAVNSGAPVWRAGANQSTRLNTATDLTFGDQTLPAGEYSVFVDLKPDAWTLIFSNHAAKQNYRDEGDALWGAFGYTDDKDVLRVPMTVEQAPNSSDQFTILFLDVTDEGGSLAMWWENTFAIADFTVGG